MYKRLLPMLLLLLTTTVYAKEDTSPTEWYQERATPGKYYDAKGLYQGKTTKDGKIYDRQGIYQGRINPDTGRITDRKGKYTGKIKPEK